MQYLLAFGNPYLNEDNLALQVADLIIKDRIKGLEVVKCVSPDEVLGYTDKDFFILDVAEGAKQATLIDDIDKLKSRSLCTLHDFDLGFFLKLMKETGKLDKVRIICIPQKGDINNIKKDVLALLTRSAES
jgi:Ni,Fe-hydrogenase maturation factor